MTTSSMAATPQGRRTGQDALITLYRQYDDRLQAWRGRPGVVGVVGSVAPVELVLAAGYTPVQVAPELPHPTPLTDPWMEDTFAWELRSVVERALRGDFEAFDLLIVTRSTHEVYYYLKEIVRQGQGASVPPLAMYDLMQSQREAVRAYGQGQTADLLTRLERLAGGPVSEDRLRDAIRLTNRKRQAIRQLLERRRGGQVSGLAAFQVIGAGYYMDPAAYTELLTEWLERLAPAPGLHGRPRLVVATSEPLYHRRLHETLEAAGALVVAEDDWWGSRAAGADIPEDAPPLAAIFEKYFSDMPTLAVSPRAPREAWLREQVDSGDLDGLVFYVPPSDHLFGWYYPALKAYLDASGVPSLLLRADVLDDTGRATISDQTRDFIATLQPGAPAPQTEAIR